MTKDQNRQRKFKKYTFKLSAGQSNSLSNYCKLKGISPNKLIKALLKNYIEDYTDEKLGKEYIDKSQLLLFQDGEDAYQQLRIFDDDSQSNEGVSY